jgi:hypothetical protein
MYDLLISAVTVEERDRLDAFMAEHQFSFDELNEAIGALMTSYTNRPMDRPSPSPAGEIPTGRPSRVVSLSRGTVKEVQPSSTDGAQAVS